MIALARKLPTAFWALLRRGVCSDENIAFSSVAVCWCAWNLSPIF